MKMNELSLTLEINPELVRRGIVTSHQLFFMAALKKATDALPFQIDGMRCCALTVMDISRIYRLSYPTMVTQKNWAIANGYVTKVQDFLKITDKWESLLLSQH